MKKRCRGCTVLKDISEFYRDPKSRTGRGRRSRCKSCTRDENYAWRAKNLDKVRRIQRRNNHKTNLLRRFGLTVQEFDFLFKRWGHRCSICRRAETRKRRLCLDHGHGSGRLRGFLCSKCNLMLGHVGDDPKLLLRAAEYLKSPPIPRAWRKQR